MNLSDLFAIPHLRSPESIALEFRAGPDHPTECLSYAELYARVEQLASALRGWGLRKGDRVAFFAGNSPRFVIAYLATIRLGGVVVPINAQYQSGELTHILGDCTPRLVFTERARVPLVRASLAENSSVETMLLAEELDSLTIDTPALRPIHIDGDDLALIMYTSGTTGRSKGAMLSHNAILATVTGLLAAWSWDASDRLLLTLPLFHTHGLIVGLNCALAAGATTLLQVGFDDGLVVERLADGDVTCFFGVPTMYVRMIRALRSRRWFDRAALHKVRLYCSGSGPLAPETFDAFRKLTGHAILERYGMTETGMNLSNPYAGPRIPGSVGIPLPGVSARIVRVNVGAGERLDVPPGEEGELLIHGANVFSGYWNAPEKSSKAFSFDASGRRWFHTGDLARKDFSTGHITLLGRIHDLIISGGFNIYPREVEEALERFPGVRDAAVVGIPDDDWGERLEAWIVCEAGLDEGALAAWCRAQLAAFKCPKAFHRVSELPRNAMGKLLKHALIEATHSSATDDSPTNL